MSQKCRNIFLIKEGKKVEIEITELIKVGKSTAYSALVIWTGNGLRKCLK